MNDNTSGDDAQKRGGGPFALRDAGAFIKAVADKTRRGPALKRTGAYLGKWLVVGVCVSLFLAVGEASTIGLLVSWQKFGVWWLITPLLVASIPMALFTVILAIEVSSFVIVVPFLLPVIFLSDRWLRALRWLVLVGCGLVGLWVVFSMGESIADPQVNASHPHVSPPGPAPSSSHFDLNALLSASVFVLAVGGGALGTVLKKVFEIVFSDWVKRKLSPSQSGRTVPLYGADGKVVRDVVLERTE